MVAWVVSWAVSWTTVVWNKLYRDAHNFFAILVPRFVRTGVVGSLDPCKALDRSTSMPLIPLPGQTTFQVEAKMWFLTILGPKVLGREVGQRSLHPFDGFLLGPHLGQTLVWWSSYVTARGDNVVLFTIYMHQFWGRVEDHHIPPTSIV
jgi:hypothetical protein